MSFMFNLVGQIIVAVGLIALGAALIYCRWSSAKLKKALSRLNEVLAKVPAVQPCIIVTSFQWESDTTEPSFLDYIQR